MAYLDGDLWRRDRCALLSDCFPLRVDVVVMVWEKRVWGRPRGWALGAGAAGAEGEVGNSLVALAGGGL